MDPDLLAKAAETACGGLFRIWGGDGERENQPGDGDSDEPDEDTQDKDKSGDTDDAGDADVDEPGDEGDYNPDEASLEERLDAERRKNIALKGRITKLQQAKQKADGDKDVAKERDELRTERDKLRTVLDTSFLEWKISSNTKYNFIDAEDVVKALDREAVSIDLETGEVEGLDLELKRIAKRKPHWLKKDEVDDDQEQRGPSGGHPGGGKVTSDEAETRRIGEKFKIPGFGSQAIRPV